MLRLPRDSQLRTRAVTLVLFAILLVTAIAIMLFQWHQGLTPGP